MPIRIVPPRIEALSDSRAPKCLPNRSPHMQIANVTTATIAHAVSASGAP